MTSPSNTCPECGKPLTGEHPVCPACLMRQALASRTIGEAGNVVPVSPPLSPEEIAHKFPGFEILECLGRGGMGVVYKARQKSLDRIVAIKILPPERVGEEKFSERFAVEAATLARLSHPNIVTVHDFGETGGLFYIVMEHVDGVNLRDLLREGKLEPKQALAIVPPICEALQYAHDKGIVHRDIKPENLLLDKDGRVKIADFGIAKLMEPVGAVCDRHASPEDEPRQARTAATLQAGTQGYAAPEQAKGPVDHRADIYALGVVLYEMLTGELPADNLEPPSRKVRIDVRLDEIVLRALEKIPELRYQTVGEFRTQVETMVASPDGMNPSQAADSVVDASLPVAPRFSRTAIVGACLIAVPFLQMFVVTGLAPRAGSGFGEIKSWWVLALVSQKFIAVIVPILATILGWIAVSQIRRSEGKLHGLWLAVFDGLLFPLLVLDFLLTFFFQQLGITCDWWTQSYDERSNAALIVWSCLTWPLVDFLIIRRVWRTVNSSNSTAPPQNGSTEKPTPSSRKLILLPAYLCIAVSFAVLFTKWWNEHRREGVWTPTRISNTIAEQHGDAQVRVVDVSQTGQVVVVCFTCEMFRPEHELMVQYGGPVLSYPNDLASAVKSKVTDLDCLITPRAKLAGDNIGEVLAGTNLLSGRTMFRIGFVLPNAQTAEKAVKAVQDTHLGKPRGLSEDRSVLLLFSLRRDSGKDAAGKPVVEGLDASLWLRPKSKAVAAQVAAAKTLSFGPVVERVIEPTNPDRYALNLASGDFVPGRNLDLSAAGVDLFASQMTSGGLDGVLTAWDMRACYCITPTKPGDFDNLTAEQLYKALAHMANWREDLEAAPIPGMNFCNVTSGITVDGLYLFITRNDLKGVLQTFPDPRGVKIRYKLVQATAATGSIDDVSANDNAAHQSPAETSRTAAMETPARVQVVALTRRRPPEVVNLLIFLGMSAAGGWWIRLGSKTGEGMGRLSLAASLLGAAGGWLFAGFGFFLFAEVGAFVTGILSRSTKFGRAGMIASFVLLVLSLLALA